MVEKYCFSGLLAPSEPAPVPVPGYSRTTFCACATPAKTTSRTKRFMDLAFITSSDLNCKAFQRPEDWRPKMIQKLSYPLGSSQQRSRHSAEKRLRSRIAGVGLR